MLFHDLKPIRELRSSRACRTFLANHPAKDSLFILKCIPRSVCSSENLNDLIKTFIVGRHIEADLPDLHFEIVESETVDEIVLARHYIPGEPLTSSLSQDPVNFLAAARMILLVGRQLNILHQQGIVHGDIKPNNIIIDKFRHPHLVDVGFGDYKNDSNILGANPSSLRYAPPEQLGLIESSTSKTSDIYSLGAVFFEVLTGTTLNTGATVNEVLRQAGSFQNQPGQMPPDLPASLATILEQMVAFDPEKRYQAWPDVEQDIQSYLQSPGENSKPLVGQKVAHLSFNDIPYIGRDSERQMLRDWLSRSVTSGADVAIITGRSGSGKSLLLHRVLEEPAAKSFKTFRGQGTVDSVQKPFQALGEAVHDLALQIKSHGLIDQFTRDLHTNLSAILQSFPFLEQIFELKRSDSTQHDLSIDFVFSSLTRMFGWANKVFDKCLIIFDDCQWLDDLSQQWLLSLTHGASDQSVGVRVLLCFRIESGSRPHALEQIESSVAIELRSFTRAEIEQLVIKGLGENNSDVVELLIKSTDQSPFMVVAMLVGMRESGLLIRENEKWQLDDIQLRSLHSDLQSSKHAASIVANRLYSVSSPTLNVLNIAAIHGRRFSLESFETFYKGRDDLVQSAIQEACERQLIVCIHPPSTYAFIHDKIREDILSKISPAEQKQIHYQIAEYYRKLGDLECSFEASFHYDRADEVDLAVPFARTAAAVALRRFSLQTAIDQLHILLRARSLSRSMRFKAYLDLARAEMLSGRFDKSVEAIAQAQGLIKNKTENALVNFSFGDLNFRKGEMQSAVHYLESSLSIYGERPPKSRFGLLSKLLFEIGIQTRSTYRGRRLRIAKESKDRPDLPICQTFNRLAYTYWFTRSSAHSAWIHLRNMNLSESKGGLSNVAQAYSEHAVICTSVGKFARGARYTRMSYNIRRKMGDYQGQGQALSFFGVSLFAGSRFRAALERFRKAEKILTHTGDMWERNTADWHAAYCLYRMGELAQAASCAEHCYTRARRTDDSMSEGVSLAILTMAKLGRTDPSLIEESLRRDTGDNLTRQQLLIAKSVRLILVDNDPVAAHPLLLRAYDLTASVGQHNEYTTVPLPWVLTCIRLRIEAIGAFATKKRKKLFREAAVFHFRFHRTLQRYQNGYPHYLREMALIYSMNGKAKQALRMIEKSIAISQLRSMKYEYLQSLLARELLKEAHGLPTNELIADQTRASIAQITQNNAAAIERSASPMIADRYRIITEHTAAILSAKKPQDVFMRTWSLVKDLFTTDSAFVFLLQNQDQNFFDIVCGKPLRFHRSLVDKALKERGSVSLFNLQNEEAELVPSHSMSYEDAICTPIVVGDVIVGGIYVAGKSSSHRFSQVDCSLLNFLSKLCGSTLEILNAAERESEKNQKLTEQVRKLDLLSSELTLAKTQAEQANRAKTSFLANISHEIRTPLSIVTGYSQLLAEHHNTDEERDHYLRIINESSTLLNFLIADVIDVARVESNQLEIQPEPADLMELMNSIIQLLEVKAKTKRLRLSLSVDPSCLTCGKLEMDTNRVKQISINLIANAIKFTDEGSVVVRCSYSSGMVSISVTDTGIGISEDQREGIFEIFNQGDVSTTKKYAGTGLGLYLGRRIANALGGDIRLDSSVIGGGSCFTLTFPAPRCLEHKGVLPAVKIIPKILPPGLEVIVIDDNEEVLVLVKNVLERAGCRRVLVFTTARDGLDYLKTARPQAVIMDLQMPEMDGIEATRLIRQRFSPNELPVIALTASGIVEKYQACREAGCNTVVSKTKVLSGLIDAICEVTHVNYELH